MQAVLRGDTQEIGKMVTGVQGQASLKERHTPQLQPIRGEGFVLIQDQGDDDETKIHTPR